MQNVLSKTFPPVGHIEEEEEEKKKNTLFIHGCLIRHIYNN